MKKTRSLLRISYCCYFLVAAAVTLVQSTEVFVGTTETEAETENLAPEVAKASPPEKEGAFVIAPETIKRFEESSEPAAPPSSSETTTRCRWGEHCPTEEKEEAQQQQSINVNKNNSASQQTTLPFVPPKKPVPEDIVDLTELVPHKPPEGFTLTARVYTDPTDKHAHFDSSSEITLPYWECGAVGSTTSPLQVKHAYFRHAIFTTETQNLWQGMEYGPHPQLLIPLAPLEVALNSGESRTFDAGNVILLEDVLSPGHVIRGVNGEHLDALIVTLPQHYHHVGKDRVSLTHQNALNNNNPCPNDVYLEGGWTNKRNRQVAFGAMGAAASSMTALFLTKVAPLWLSVGIGGTCFIVGGTAATITCGEAVIEQVQTYLEQKRLSQNIEQVVKVEEEENEEEEDEEVDVAEAQDS